MKQVQQSIIMLVSVVEGVEMLGRALEAGKIGFEAVKEVIRSLKDGLDGKTSPEVVLAEMAALREQLDADNAQAFADLRAKFPKES